MPKKESYIVTMSIERISPTPDLSEILETVELGTFNNEEEARECLNDILEGNGYEDEDEPAE